MDTFVDIHCHPYAKPFGQSQPKSRQSPDPRNKTSVWQHDPPTLLDKLTNFILTLTRFRQPT